MINLGPNFKTEGWLRSSAPERRRFIGRTTSAVSTLWYRSMLPKHFDFGAAKEYKYERRTAEYMKTKARMKRHQRPMTWSGAMRREALSGAIANTVGMDTRLKIRAKALNFSSRANYPNLAEEIKLISEREYKIISRFAGNFYAKVLDKS